MYLSNDNTEAKQKLIAVGTLVLRAEIICVQQNIALEFLKKINGLVNEFKLLFVKKSVP